MLAFFQRARDPVSSYTHFLGAVFSLLGGALLLCKSVQNPQFSVLKLLSVLVFAISLLALYTASAVYHYAAVAPKTLLRLRKLDHAMIYILIAGTYTPIIYNVFPEPLAVYFTVGMWLFAFAGICLKFCWMGAPRWLSTVVYIVMGWAIMIDVPALAQLGPMGIALLAGGGLAYTAGAVIYAVKKPNLLRSFGFHELFHIFVLLGSLLHFLLIYCFLA